MQADHIFWIGTGCTDKIGPSAETAVGSTMFGIFDIE